MKQFRASIMLLFAVIVVSVTQAAGIWGTLKPNLYFAVKELAREQNVLGLAWMVKDWRTD